jgi:hypothetical protein
MLLPLRLRLFCGEASAGRLRHRPPPQLLWGRRGPAEHVVGFFVFGERGVQLLDEVGFEACGEFL